MDFLEGILDNRYEVLEKIYETPLNEVYRARVKQNKEQDCVIKILKPQMVSQQVEDIIRFQNELHKIMELESPLIEKIFDVFERDNIQYVVAEFISGRSLEEYFLAGTDFSIAEVISIVAKIAAGLDFVHQHGILHRDLSPAHIFLQRDAQRITDLKIINFALARVRIFDFFQTPAEIESNFGYKSPEECGVMNRVVEESSDLYSLGILMFQMLTRQLPFRGDNISVLIHQHVAAQPQAPSTLNSGVTGMLNKIVLKLLEKEPGKRYQSAGGLLRDLEKYSAGEVDFKLALEDKITRLSYKTNLIGRDDELKALVKLFNKAIEHRKGNVCLIGGPSGQGKSRLVKELLEYAYSRDIVFLTGRSYTAENRIPYAPVKEALTQYLRIFETYSAKRQKYIRDALNYELGDFGKIIINLNPALSVLFPDVKDLVKMDKDKENSRFIDKVEKFFIHLAQIENGLVIYFDDLQWADEGSLEVLNALSCEVETAPLLILGTYRDDELTYNHGLKKIINESFNNDRSLEQISLEPFLLSSMTEYISSILHGKSENIKKIAALVQTKSKGNPFFAVEIIKQLFNEGAVYYENHDWMINLAVLDSIEISPIVIEVVLKRISLLNNIEKEILSIAAIIGREFDIVLLFQLCSFKQTLIIEAVDRAISLHLLEYEIQNSKKIVFIHERIKEAFYEIIPDDQRRKLHIAIAGSLEKAEINLKSGELLFDLANHYIAGGLEDKILEYAYPAGIKAKSHYAHAEADKYFTLTLRLLTERGLEGSQLWIDVNRKLAEVCLIVGEYDRGITLLNTILPGLKANVERARIYRQITEAFYKRGDNQKCEAAGRQGLALLGESLPVRRIPVVLGIVKELLIHLLHILFPFFFIRKRPSKNPEKYQLIILFYLNINWSYVISDMLKFLRSILRMLNLSESKLGKSPELSMSIGGYAALCMTLGWFKRSLKYHEKGLSLKREMNDQYGIAQSLQFLGYCYEWQGHYRAAIEHFARSSEIFDAIGDRKEYAISITGIAECHFLLAEYESAYQLIKKYKKIADHSRDVYAISNSFNNLLQIFFEQGKYEKAESMGNRGYKLSLENELWLINAKLAIEFCRLYNVRSESVKALTLLKQTRGIERKQMLLGHYVSHLDTVYAEASLLNYSINMIMKRNGDKTELRKIRKLCRSALRKTKTWVTHYSSSLLVNAKFYALQGRSLVAKRFFLMSIRQAEKLGRKYHEANAYFEYGLFLKQLNKETESIFVLRKAYKIFTDIHSIILRKKVGDLLGILQENNSDSLKDRFINQQRFSSIIQVNQDMSSTLDVQDLLKKVLDNALKISGAQRGCLFIKSEETEDLEVKTLIHMTAGDLDDHLLTLVREVYSSEKSILLGGSDEDHGSILCLPLIAKDDVVGVCYLENQLSNHVFSEGDRDILDIILRQAAIYYNHASLYEQATLDGLTKLFIYRHFQHLLNQEIKRTQRYGRPCSLIMIDVDYFKVINDQHGHQVGDKVLQAIAEIIKENCRDTDLAARYGGEEFCVILPETSREEAARAAENIRLAVEKYSWSYIDEDADVTISLGIAEYPFHAGSKDELIKLADTAMYHSKRNGRNRSSIYDRQIMGKDNVPTYD